MAARASRRRDRGRHAPVRGEDHEQRRRGRAPSRDTARRPPAPEWSPNPGERWHRAADLADAAKLLPGLGTRVFLTIGRQGVDAFAGLHALWFLIRAIDPPDVATPPESTLLLARGPFTVTDEIALMREHRIDILVTKNSGGGQTDAKLDAARELSVPVVMIRRPPLPSGPQRWTTSRERSSKSTRSPMRRRPR